MAETDGQAVHNLMAVFPWWPAGLKLRWAVNVQPSSSAGNLSDPYTDSLCFFRKQTHMYKKSPNIGTVQFSPATPDFTNWFRQDFSSFS